MTDDAYATWSAEIALAPGKNMLAVETRDAAGNIDSSASQISVRSNGRFGRVTGIAYDDATATAYVTDSAIGGLWKVDLDPASDGGLRTILSDRGSPDASNVVVGPNAVLLEGSTGARTIFSDNSTPGSAKSFAGPQAIVVDEDNGRALIGDTMPLTATSSLLAANLSTGARSVLSADGTPGSSNGFSSVRGLALDYADNGALLADRARLFAIDLTSGARMVLSESAPPNHINPMGVTEGIAYDPATKVVYVVDDSFSAVTAIDTVTGRRVYMLE